MMSMSTKMQLIYLFIYTTCTYFLWIYKQYVIIVLFSCAVLLVPKLLVLKIFFCWLMKKTFCSAILFAKKTIILYFKCEKWSWTLFLLIGAKMTCWFKGLMDVLLTGPGVNRFKDWPVTDGRECLFLFYEIT